MLWTIGGVLPGPSTERAVYCYASAVYIMPDLAVLVESSVWIVRKTWIDVLMPGVRVDTFDSSHLEMSIGFNTWTSVAG